MHNKGISKKEYIEYESKVADWENIFKNGYTPQENEEVNQAQEFNELICELIGKQDIDSDNACMWQKLIDRLEKVKLNKYR